MGAIACVGNGSLYCVRPTRAYYATNAPHHHDEDDDDEYVHCNCYDKRGILMMERRS